MCLGALFVKAGTCSPTGSLPEQPFGLQVFIVQEGIIGVHAQTLLVPRLTLYSVCAQTLQWVGQASVLLRVQRYHLPIPPTSRSLHVPSDKHLFRHLFFKAPLQLPPVAPLPAPPRGGGRALQALNRLINLSTSASPPCAYAPAPALTAAAVVAFFLSLLSLLLSFISVFLFCYDAAKVQKRKGIPLPCNGMPMPCQRFAKMTIS